MFFNSPKPSPQEMTLSSSNSKNIIKDCHANLMLHPLVENASSFASSSITCEKDSIIVFQEIKAKPGARQTNNLTEQKDTSNKGRSKHIANKISKEQEQQQQSNTLQSNSKEKLSNDAVNEM